MSCINEFTKITPTSVFGVQDSQSVTNTTTNENSDFDSVMLQALQNCNGKRPEHVCCCNTPQTEEIEENQEEEKIEANKSSLLPEIETEKENEATEEEKLSAGSCFTMLIKISAKINTYINNTLGGKFKDTTLAFVDALKADKSYNENLLTAYMKKTEDMISSQREEMKNYLSSYLDNILSAVKSSVSGINSTLLSSSNLLGNSLSDYSNLLSNSSLLNSSSLFGSGNSLASNLLSSFSSSLNSYSNSSSLAGYSAIEAANTQINALLKGNSNYSYGIGTSLNTNRYAGRNLSIIKSSEIETSASGGLKMVDTKGNATSGVAATGVEIGDSVNKSIASASSSSNNLNNAVSVDSSSNSAVAETVSVKTPESENQSDVEVQLVSNINDNSYIEALKRKNHIIDLFKEMILNSLKGQKDNDDIKNIDAKVNIFIA